MPWLAKKQGVSNLLYSIFLLFVGVGSLFVFAESVSAYTVDTTNSNMYDRHEYTIHNVGSCGFDYSVTLNYSTTGDTFFYSENIKRSGHLDAGASKTLGYIEFRTVQCHTGTADSRIDVVVTNNCGTANISKSAHTDFIASCQKYWCTTTNQCTSGTTCPNGKSCYSDNTSCINHAAADCPAPTVYWCTTTNQCTSGTSCPNGKNCYSNNTSCLNNAATDCGTPPAVYWCTTTNQCTSGTSCPNGKNCYSDNSSCVSHASTDCGTPPAVYWCTTTNQCTSGTSCPNGKNCYSNNTSCLNNAATDCGTPLTYYWCLPNSNETNCPHSGTQAQCQAAGAQCFTDLNQCNVGATDRCANLPPQTFYWCVPNSGEQTCPHSGTYTSEAACELANPGVDCFNNQATCNTDAPTRCAQQVQPFWWCLPLIRLICLVIRRK